MNTTQLFQQLWNEYVERTPSAKKIQELFKKEYGTFSNDHIALRTFNIEGIDINALAKPFIANGYVEKDHYMFPEKKLFAKHFEHATDAEAPLVFISEIILEEFSFTTQETIKNLINQLDFNQLNQDALIFEGRPWEQPSYITYQQLLKESEYIAWLYVNGFCTNHFTVNVNSLNGDPSLAEVNNFLKNNGYQLNTSGGEIKGNAHLLLEQSSIVADKITIAFAEGAFEITSCYYEFAFRHIDSSNKLFKGFIANSADKIFESTNMELAVS